MIKLDSIGIFLGVTAILRRNSIVVMIASIVLRGISRIKINPITINFDSVYEGPGRVKPADYLAFVVGWLSWGYLASSCRTTYYPFQTAGNPKFPVFRCLSYPILPFWNSLKPFCGRSFLKKADFRLPLFARAELLFLVHSPANPRGLNLHYRNSADQFTQDEPIPIENGNNYFLDLLRFHGGNRLRPESVDVIP